MHIVIANRGSPWWPWVLEWQLTSMRGSVRWFYQHEADARRDAHMLTAMYGGTPK